MSIHIKVDVQLADTLHQNNVFVTVEQDTDETIDTAAVSKDLAKAARDAAQAALNG